MSERTVKLSGPGGLDALIGQWAQIGAGFSGALSGRTPDLERLLLATAQRAPESARLFVMAATWLNEYGDLVAKHRLRRLIRDEMAAGDRPALGLLLEIAQEGTHPPEFQMVTKTIAPGAPFPPSPAGAWEGGARPLFEAERSPAALVLRAERRASELSRRWGLWCEPIELKRDDALRPARWVMARNPGFITRADLRGDLRASVLASLEYDGGAGESEMGLARAAGGSRAQVRAALDNLEMTGRVERVREAGTRRVGVRLGEVG